LGRGPASRWCTARTEPLGSWRRRRSLRGPAAAPRRRCAPACGPVVGLRDRGEGGRGGGAFDRGPGLGAARAGPGVGEQAAAAGPRRGAHLPPHAHQRSRFGPAGQRGGGAGRWDDARGEMRPARGRVGCGAAGGDGGPPPPPAPAAARPPAAPLLDGGVAGEGGGRGEALGRGPARGAAWAGQGGGAGTAPCRARRPGPHRRARQPFLRARLQPRC
jgi:hypothetical protein